MTRKRYINYKQRKPTYTGKVKVGSGSLLTNDQGVALFDDDGLALLQPVHLAADGVRHEADQQREEEHPADRQGYRHQPSLPRRLRSERKLDPCAASISGMMSGSLCEVDDWC